ncbi:hypothetical protein ACQKWADRAFT_301081 [Trichoderma austrokoningii]
MAKRKLNSGSARSRKRTKLDGPQDVATGSQAGSSRTRRVERSSPPPPRSLSPTKADAGQHEGSKRKRADDSNQDSSNAPAAKRARSSQSLGEPTGAEAGPSRPRSESAQEIIGFSKLSPRTRAKRTMGVVAMIPIGQRAGQEEESSDSEESRSESPASYKPWPDLQAGPSHPSLPDRAQSLEPLTHRYTLADEVPSPDHGPSPRNFGPATRELFESESDSDEPRQLRRPRTPQRPRGPLTSPSPSPPPALQQPASQQQQQMQQYSRSSSSDRTDIVDEETMAAWAASVISESQLDRRSRQRSPSQRRPSPVPPPAETRPVVMARVDI